MACARFSFALFFYELQSTMKMEINVGKKSKLWLVAMIIELLLLLSASSAEVLPTRKNHGRTVSNPLEVQLHTNVPNKIVVANGLVAVTIENPSGYVTDIKYKGLDNVLETSNLHSNKGYWDIVWDAGAYDKLETTKFKVITRTDDLVELSFTRKWDFKTTEHDNKTVPLNIDKRFIVRRGVPGIYMYGIFERREDFPDANMYQARIVFKLNEKKFRFMAISDTRQRVMPRGEDRDDTRSEILAFKEAVVLSNPSESELRGEVDDKYQYSIENKDNKIHGWISDDDAVGFWVITPSNEFRTGGPHKQDLTVHAGPIALSMFVSTHYTGLDIDTAYKKGDAWKKVFGPVFVYMNSASPGGDVRKTLWNDAKRQMCEETASWPYNFTRSEDFPHAEQRGEVSGQLLVRDRCMAEELIMRAKSAYVGLAAPGYAGSWQTEGKGYQFWTQTDNTGRFIIKNVRPGKYNFYGWVHGFIGTYKLDLNITIHPGNKMNLGTLIYDPPRNGPTLWEIGIPDRTAAEFFIPDPYPTLTNSLYSDEDKFRQYGIWDRYSDIYREGDLVFTVGVSNYSQHWFYAHVPRNVGNNTYHPTTWQIKFDLQSVNHLGNYTLQLALAAAAFAELEIRFNHPNSVKPFFTTTRIGSDNAVARHGIHGLYRLFSINVPGNTFQKGDNTIYLTQTKCQDAFKAVMYDYIRLEGPTV